jgi:hypothetical protein
LRRGIQYDILVSYLLKQLFNSVFVGDIPTLEIPSLTSGPTVASTAPSCFEAKTACRMTSNVSGEPLTDECGVLVTAVTHVISIKIEHLGPDFQFSVGRIDCLLGLCSLFVTQYAGNGMQRVRVTSAGVLLFAKQQTAAG